MQAKISNFTTFSNYFLKHICILQNRVREEKILLFFGKEERFLIHFSIKTVENIPRTSLLFKQLFLLHFKPAHIFLKALIGLLYLHLKFSPFLLVSFCVALENSICFYCYSELEVIPSLKDTKALHYYIQM